MNIRNVTIEWTYPKQIDKVFDDERINNIGIYCIYRVYGTTETLLYIGKTFNSFKSRLKMHNESWINDYRGEKYVRLGNIISPQNYHDVLLTDVESALIYEKNPKPIHNTDKINGYRYTYDLNIYNIGYRGQLPKLISNRNQI